MVSDCLAGCLLANKAMEASTINHWTTMTFMWRAQVQTATLSASSSNCRPHEAIGRANSQSPLCCVQAAKKEARLWGEFSDDSTTALSANTPGRSQNGWLGGRILGMSPNWADQEIKHDWRKLMSEETQPDKMSDWSDRVLAEEATKAGSVNEDTRLIHSPSSRTGRLVWIHWHSEKLQLLISCMARLRIASKLLSLWWLVGGLQRSRWRTLSAERWTKQN